MSIYLDMDELTRLTGTKRKHLQIEWLQKNGFIYSENRAGEPILAREHVLARLGVVSPNRISNRIEPNIPRLMKG